MAIDCADCGATQAVEKMLIRGKEAFCPDCISRYITLARRMGDPIATAWVNGWKCDFLSGQCCRAGTQKSLTPTENHILQALVAQRGRVVSLVAIQAAVWPDSDGVESSVVRKYVQRVRSKLGAAAIESRQRYGYSVPLQEGRASEQATQARGQ